MVFPQGWTRSEKPGGLVRWEWDGRNRLTAEVEGSAPDPHRLVLSFDEMGWPHSECDCPFDWEPLCKHAVAAPLAWRADEWGEGSEESFLQRLSQK